MSDYVELKILRATPKMPARWNDPDSYDVQLQLSRPLGLSASCWQVGCLGCLFPGGLTHLEFVFHGWHHADTGMQS
ncbi:hypothetical protein, partial [Mobiluncus mulieris]|uniref:hypothetical protein n=1 Tax=Mobiluncus mulieris TaxID=2052 RepID=UPI001BAB7A43